jgi:hypothetical protein
LVRYLILQFAFVLACSRHVCSFLPELGASDVFMSHEVDEFP